MDGVKTALTTSVVNKVAGFVGIENTLIKGAISKLLPVLIWGFIRKGSSNTGSQGLLDLIKGRDDLSSNSPLDLEGIFSNKESGDNFLSQGGDILSAVLGGGQQGVISKLMRFAGLGKGVTGSILSFLGPIILKKIAGSVMSNKLDAGGLSNFLSGQKSNILGTNKDVASFFQEERAATTTASATATRPERSTVTETSSGGGLGLLKWLLPVAAIAAIGWFFTRGGASDATEAITATTAKAVEKVENTTTTASAASAYTVADGSLKWIGAKALGSSHEGTINVSNGNLSVNNGQVTGGTFTIDMNSINNTDQEAGSGKEKLEGHLKNADFFDTGKFPTGTFTITGVAPVSGDANVSHNVTGNLKLKGVEKSITIPAKIMVNGGKVSASTPTFTINRTDWGIQYGSGSIAGLAKDKIINDDITLQLNLTANAAAN